jgi:hypothetical protein
MSEVVFEAGFENATIIRFPQPGRHRAMSKAYISPQLKKWCKDNFNNIPKLKDSVSIVNDIYVYKYTFNFQNDNDAVLFKMFWV